MRSQDTGSYWSIHREASVTLVCAYGNQSHPLRQYYMYTRARSIQVFHALQSQLLHQAIHVESKEPICTKSIVRGMYVSARDFYM